MRVAAKLKTARISPQKVRLVADQIRGLRVDAAMQILQFSPLKAARIVRSVLDSAIANAEHNEGADIDELKVDRICIDAGSVLKRLRARAKGRANRITKRTSHITITVSD